MKEIEMVSVRINGREIEAEKGCTILRAASDQGVRIPTLCHHEALEAFGSCRLCVVEIRQGRRRRLVTACNFEIREGLEIETDSDRVRASRRMTVELLLSRCPEAEVLKNLALEYGIKQPRFPAEEHDCILCGLCVRICRQRMGVGAAYFVGRGTEMQVEAPYKRASEVCLSCGACAVVCPTQAIRLQSIYPAPPVPQLSEFEAGMRERSSINIPFPQALPNLPVIDRENCVHFQTEACGICRETCPAGAIDYSQQDENISVAAGAVILAPGFCLYDAARRPELGYGRYRNVVSSLQFERILSASGPYLGKVLRPSDLRPPERIAFIQCVGSREEEHDFCSSVCCMYAIKEAIIAKEHDPDIEFAIFYMDIRAVGKDFDSYYERAKELGIQFIPCRPARVEEVAGSKHLRIGYTTDGGYESREFDMVVLSNGLQPPADSEQLAATFGIELNRHGFAATRRFDPTATSRAGVYVCGPFAAPKDIPETVMEASSAASRAMLDLAAVRGEEISVQELPPETNSWGLPLRIGVFVCHCGKNIGGVVDVPAVAEYARGLPHVVYAADNLYTCSADTQMAIKEIIREQRLNRVVVASCSPRTHEPLFQQTLREAGLNPHLFEMANIRDQCSWVHMQQGREATEKSRDLVRMAVAKAGRLEALKSITLPVTPKALVVGGGLAGLTCSLTIAGQGFQVYLVERSTELGGNARYLDRTLDGADSRSHLNELITRVKKHANIKLYTDSRLSKVEGFVGNFVSQIRRNGEMPEVQEIEHGVAVLATGGRESAPVEYHYGESGNIKTLLELSADLAAPDFQVPDTLVMIQCVGSREPEHAYCSRVCCQGAIRAALRIKELNPEANVFILYRDVRSYGFREEYYTRARKQGVCFVRYTPERKPVVKPAGDKVLVTVYDPILDAELEISSDLLVLSSRVDPNPENESLSQFFKVPLNKDRFFLEAHVKLRPVDFATEGVYMCGLAHYAKDMEETISQAQAASSRAVTVLSRENLQAPGKVAYVAESRCSGCGSCVPVCAYNAISRDDERRVAVINEALCKGCGACAATCRAAAIRLRGFEDSQILSMLQVVTYNGERG
jgi:heterodisulfide reductase subunit A